MGIGQLLSLVQLHFWYRCWDIEVVLAPDPVGLVYRYTSQSLH